MTRSGRPQAELVLSDVERDTLSRWTRRAKTSQALALRARIVLACAEGSTNKDVAARLGVWPQTGTKWLGGGAEEPRPGAARTITDEQVESVIVKTLEEKPASGDTHWSTRSMARSLGMSQTSISRIWRACGLKPHLVDTWKLSTDPQFIEKVRDIVGLRHAAHDAGHPRPQNPRLRPLRHHQSVRRAGHRHRQGHRPAPAATPPSGVPPVPQDHRQEHPLRTGPAPDLRQLRHPHDPGA